jgi:uncharacterized delta-60 repeat protein
MSRLRPVSALVGGLLLVTFTALPASAAAGDLDASFGSGGKVRTNVAASHGIVGVVVDAAHRTVALGDSGKRFEVIRYRQDGTRDPGFSGDGIARVGFLNAITAAPGGIALAPGGAIVVAGTTEYSGGKVRMAIARLTLAGVLDPAFSGDGKLVLPGAATATAVAVRANGDIVAAGNCGTAFAVQEVLSDGTPDAGFGSQGRACVHHGMTDEAKAVALDGLGRVVVGGENLDATNPESKRSDFLVARLTTGGSLDLSFSGDGWKATNFAERDEVDGLTVAAGNAIVAAGTADSSSTASTFALAKYTEAGVLDTSFGGGDGKVTTQFGSHSNGSAAGGIAQQADGKLVVAGRVFSTSNTRESFAVARYRSGGGLDSSFGGNGKVTTQFALDAAATSIAVDPSNGRIVAGGAEFPPSGSEPWVLARYHDA